MAGQGRVDAAVPVAPRPSGPGWRRVFARAGRSDRVRSRADGMPPSGLVNVSTDRLDRNGAVDREHTYPTIRTLFPRSSVAGGLERVGGSIPSTSCAVLTRGGRHARSPSIKDRHGRTGDPMDPGDNVSRIRREKTARRARANAGWRERRESRGWTQEEEKMQKGEKVEKGETAQEGEKTQEENTERKTRINRERS